MKIQSALISAMFLVLAGLFSGIGFTYAEAAPSNPISLDQNWSARTRQKFYTTSQGSQIMPYSWFTALERANSKKGFYADGLKRHGFIPNPRSRRFNPDGLPVGWVLDKDRTGWWIGLTCAACHTNQIEYNGTVMQIDGGPALGDFFAFLKGLENSLAATTSDQNSGKFKRFAKKVLGRTYPAGATRLFKKVKAKSDDWAKFVKVSTPKHAWGRARLDAFGMIFNRVSAIDLGIPGNSKEPNAPVSYPYLWNASWLQKVQWNGIADNAGKSKIKSDLLRLSRNVGEVLGVFANAKLKKPTLLHYYYKTSARRIAMIGIEERLKKLTPPIWPENILGNIDHAKAKDGKVLFDKHCKSCHTVVPHGEQNTPLQIRMTPVSKLGTDRMMASNACNREVSPGVLAGVKMPPLIGKKLTNPTKTAALLTNVVAGAIIAPPSFRGLHLIRRSTAADDPSHIRTEISDLTERLRFSLRSEARRAEDVPRMLTPEERHKILSEKKVGKDIHKIMADNITKTQEATSDCGKDSPLMQYIGRPLNGIWATAPYMHNGSIANLYEVLLPEKERMKTFNVGSKKFNPAKVGFSTKPGPGTFKFDTSLPGNSNKGHNYGNNQFTPDERKALVEYKKGL